MAVSSNLEMRFVELRKEIERYASINDYAQTKALIEKAMPLCSQIYGETSDPEKKKVMMRNAEKLKEMYAYCEGKLGGDEEITYSPKPQNPQKPKPAPGVKSEKPQSGSPKKDGGKDNGDVNYVINGVDVAQFLVRDSNDVVTFDDVKGMTEEKALIEREFFLTDEERAFNEFLGKKPKTFILLYGVPGTGKTFFAKAISQELKNRMGEDIPFFSIVGSQLSDSKVGQSEKNIQAVFEFCKQFERCVLFIDEFDTLAPDRKQASGDPTAGSRVTVLLQMMDGFSSAKGTLVIAATNCPYNLDGAILSRANTRIEIPLPAYEVIYDILWAKIGANIAADVNLESLAARLNGYSNRDIKNFIETMKDMLVDEFSRSRKQGDMRAFEDFKYTNDMIDKSLSKIVPSTKQSDIDRIAQFKLMND